MECIQYSMNTTQQTQIIDNIKIGDIFENINHLVKYYKVIEITENYNYLGTRYIVQSVNEEWIKQTIWSSDLLKNDGVYGKREGFIPVKVLEAEN